MAGLNCIECGSGVVGDGQPQERGFCSTRCQRSWDEWRLRDRGSELPGLGPLFRDGGWPSFEQAVEYAMDALGCAVEVFPAAERGKTVELWFDWSVPNHEIFALCADGGHEDLRKAFSKIDGFELTENDQGEFDTPENIGFRVGAISRAGQDLAMMCVDLILEVIARRRRFMNQCDRWAKAHVEDLWGAAGSLAGNLDPALIDEISGFLDWLQKLDPEAGESRLRGVPEA